MQALQTHASLVSLESVQTVGSLYLCELAITKDDPLHDDATGSLEAQGPVTHQQRVDSGTTRTSSSLPVQPNPTEQVVRTTGPFGPERGPVEADTARLLNYGPNAYAHSTQYGSVSVKSDVAPPKKVAASSQCANSSSITLGNPSTPPHPSSRMHRSC